MLTLDLDLNFCIGYVLPVVVSICHPISGIHLMNHWVPSFGLHSFCHNDAHFLLLLLCSWGNWEVIHHPEGCTVTEKIWTVTGICDYEGVQVLFTPELQVGTELFKY